MYHSKNKSSVHTIKTLLFVIFCSYYNILVIILFTRSVVRIAATNRRVFVPYSFFIIIIIFVMFFSADRIIRAWCIFYVRLIINRPSRAETKGSSSSTSSSSEAQKLYELTQSYNNNITVDYVNV